MINLSKVRAKCLGHGCVVRSFFVAFLIFVSLNAEISFSQENPVARTLSYQGDVRVADSLVKAQQGQPFFQGLGLFEQDLIRSKAESQAIWVFSNHSLGRIGERSQVRIHAWNVEPTQPKVIHLLEGVLDFISGPELHHHPESFKVETEYATVGIEGTYFRLVVVPKGLWAKVYHGSISLTNETGVLILQAGTDEDEALVRAYDQRPEVRRLEPLSMGIEEASLVNQPIFHKQNAINPGASHTLSSPASAPPNLPAQYNLQEGFAQ